MSSTSFSSPDSFSACEAAKPVHLFNTQSRQVELFTPLTPGEVRMYCCGPTVYAYQHIGNLRTYIFEDLLARSLRKAGYKVTHVMNVTDVGHLVSDADEGQDKMLLAAQREKKKSFEIADYYTKVFLEDCDKLRIGRPTIICKATDHIKEMIDLIKRLEEKGLAYQAGGNIYFDVGRFPDYGKLAGLNLEALKAGARIEVDTNKRSPLDFALWFTKSKFEDQELQWESPWGTGYPGWHIECSAMALRYLGEHFDIHCGGIDHIAVHHTNEIAQTEGATGHRSVNLWMHGAFLEQSAGEKMSKSKGDTLRVRTIEERGIDPMAYRFFCYGALYRKPLMFSWDALENAAKSYAKLKRQVLNLPQEAKSLTEHGGAISENYARAFDEAVLNDLNTPQALALIWEILGSAQLAPSEKLATLYYGDSYLHLGMQEWHEAEVQLIPGEILQLAAERAAARAAKDWKRSDEIRATISSRGFVLEDTPEGPKLSKK